MLIINVIRAMQYIASSIRNGSYHCSATMLQIDVKFFYYNAFKDAQFRINKTTFCFNQNKEAVEKCSLLEQRSGEHAPLRQLV